MKPPPFCNPCRVCGWPWCVTPVCALCEEKAFWREADQGDFWVWVYLAAFGLVFAAMLTTILVIRFR